MPFKSEAQRNFMFAKHPKLAKKWAKETTEENLPKYKNAKPNKSGPKSPWLKMK